MKSAAGLVAVGPPEADHPTVGICRIGWADVSPTTRSGREPDTQPERSFLRERGFSLLEVIIAIALVAIVAVAIYAGLATASKTAIITDVRATAESLARTQMETMKKIDYTPAIGGEASYTNAKITLAGYEIRSIKLDGTSEDTSPNIIAVAWNTTTGKPELNADNGLQRIKLAIYHHDKTQPLFTLEDYKVKR